jgi:hypothetical protein
MSSGRRRRLIADQLCDKQRAGMDPALKTRAVMLRGMIPGCATDAARYERGPDIAYERVSEKPAGGTLRCTEVDLGKHRH